ncbi:hypothetical protein [Spirosoma radiotolerans]|uniref:DUF5666 domain-containing protein n=1 Tax=Spirosoma radiotolerans TaxID=1379870 RepID=A0A0E3ZY03_9BACT|nr:hypothetical protein [Spirosoma radiotolerans]AKD56734.1 hypothetical protein SD10_19335 [Spirosoma radiotolerans]
METNTRLIATVALALALASPFAHAQGPDGPPVAQNQPGVDGPSGPLPGGPGRRHGRPGPGLDRNDHGKGQGPGRNHQMSGLTSLTTVSGTVGQLVGNDDFILDGFTLNAGSGSPVTVKFPPHLGTQVQKAIKAGSSVSVTGYSETPPGGETRFRMNSLTVGKTTVLDSPPVRPTTPPDAPALATATGKIADYRLDREGRVNGLVLDDKTVISIPSHVAYQLTDLAKKGSTITVQGYPKTLRDGQVQLEKVNVLRASVLTINGQQYLVR